MTSYISAVISADSSAGEECTIDELDLPSISEPEIVEENGIQNKIDDYAVASSHNDDNGLMSDLIEEHPIQEGVYETDEISDEISEDQLNHNIEEPVSDNAEDQWNDDTTDQWGDVVQTEMTNNWCSIEQQLTYQANGGSFIAKHLASLGILIQSGNWELIAAECAAQKRIDAQKSIALRREHHKRTILLDASDCLVRLLDQLQDMQHDRPQVVIDCEGFYFDGPRLSIDILELFVIPQNKLYMIDIVALGEKAWSTTATTSAFCLRDFLSSNSCKKIMWDCRMDAHFLKNGYDIQLSGIIDSSIWALGYCKYRTTRYSDSRLGIVRACKELLCDSLYPCELERLEAAHSARASLRQRAWRIRPLYPVLIDYAADVKYMGRIYHHVEKRLNKPETQRIIWEIEHLTGQELDIASDPFWNARCERDAGGPWSPGYIKGARMVLQSNREDAARELSEWGGWNS